MILFQFAARPVLHEEAFGLTMLNLVRGLAFLAQ